jgi:signal transduction histidine kinase
VAELERDASSPKSAKGAAGMRGELSRLSEDVHSLAYQLHPSTLDELGLTEALRIECERVTSPESVTVSLQAPEKRPRVSQEIALCLFRVAQEGLRNVVRHAHARAVALRLEATDGAAHLTIRDDGVGFDPAQGRARPGLGLESMRERVALVGGRIEIRSAPGRGTTIEVWAPLETRSQ